MRQPISNQCAVAVALAAKILQLNYFFPATLPIVHFVTCALLLVNIFAQLVQSRSSMTVVGRFHFVPKQGLLQHFEK